MRGGPNIFHKGKCFGWDFAGKLLSQHVTVAIHGAQRGLDVV